MNNNNTKPDYSQLLLHLTSFNQKNTTNVWGGSDTKELFDNHMKVSKTRHELEVHGWIGKEIVYQYNSQGFRSPEFEEKENFLAMGCSFTEGTGVSAEQSWGSALSTMIGLNHWNLGISSSSIMTVAQLIEPALRTLTPKFVCVLVPPKDRTDVINTLGLANTYSPSFNYDSRGLFGSTSTSTFLKQWFAAPKNGLRQTEVCCGYIKHICNEYSVPVVILDLLCCRNIAAIDLARDLGHFGPKTYRGYARLFWADLVRQGVL